MVSDQHRIRHVILDRDGVLAQELPGRVLCSVADWRWERGARAALDRLAMDGTMVSVATNQSCIGRGLLTAAEVGELHTWLGTEMRRSGVLLNGIFVCPHAPFDTCSCRKPKPGLLIAAIERSGISPSETAMIGDAERDIAAAEAAGIRGLLVRTGKAGGASPPKGIPAFDHVGEAVDACAGGPRAPMGLGS